MSDTMPFEDSEPTVEAIASFFSAYLEILELHYEFPTKKTLRSQARIGQQLFAAPSTIGYSS